jgi:hypothetical protein
MIMLVVWNIRSIGRNYVIYQMCDVAALVSLPMSCLFFILIIISSDWNLNRIIRWQRYFLSFTFHFAPPWVPVFHARAGESS